MSSLSRKTVMLAVILSGVAAPIVSNAALVSTDGGLGVYDSINNVTWTSDANLMATQAASYSGGAAAFVSAMIVDSGGVIHDAPNAFDTVPNSGSYTLSANDFNTSTGGMDWWGAQAWINYLNATSYGGSNRWTLPTTVDASSSFGYPNGGSGTYNGQSLDAVSTSELAQLFYGGLGQVAGTAISTTHNGNYSLFSNLQGSLVGDQPAVYWSGTQYSANPNNGAWIFETASNLNYSGYQGTSGQTYDQYALAVSSGDVTPVPLPAAAWLMITGLGGLGAMSRKRHPCA